MDKNNDEISSNKAASVFVTQVEQSCKCKIMQDVEGEILQISN